MADTQSSQERIERLKALLTGKSSSGRVGAALSSSGTYGNLLLGVALHGADRVREAKTLTDLERLLVDALGTVIEAAEVKEWGAAYRATVRTAAPGTLIVPEEITKRPSSTGYSMVDLEQVMPQLTKEAFEAPNLSLLTAEDIAAGRIEEDPAFVEAMGERGFAVTGVARYPDSAGATRAAAAGAKPAAESWRVKMEMENFHVVRAVGDQGGGRDEIYFTAASSVGGDDGGESFVSEEFGAVKKNQTRNFSASRKVFLDKQSTSDLMITNIQVWEADQSNSKWYDQLQFSLNTAVTQIDRLLNNPVAVIADPIPLEVAIAYEVAKVFIGLMDALRNKDDLSCSRTFVLTRNDMAVLHHKPDLEWNFNGDGHHKLRVRYTGERPKWPTGHIEITSRAEGNPSEWSAAAWSAPIPLGWKTTTRPAIASYRGDLYTVFSRPGDNRIVWCRYDGAAWTAPLTLQGAASDQPSALAVHNDQLHCMYTGGDRHLYHTWFDGQEWIPEQKITTAWTSEYGPSLAEFDGVLWSAHNGAGQVYLSPCRGGWNDAQLVKTASVHSAPALSAWDNTIAFDHRNADGRIVACTTPNPPDGVQLLRISGCRRVVTVDDSCGMPVG
ncbi:hypothetical protein EES41_36815 (plasmid) [Streptomyces sp. ADI95-16]|uniref:hypothetical protein n=1 Tax=Streptomyces sp. ADI95-16 TaxID=1522758 RepID=UPI000F3AA958|nr:hypothetical protein [Streptomyces sp. ADI95-16]AYV32324.1 hypothetical protein EES41_36815 [Streptomyces sp. ADI95-16]